MNHRHALVISCLALAALSATAATARVVAVEIDRQEPVLDGKPFGLAGPYEKLVGRVLYAVDPANPGNRMVVDIDLAPTNAAGEVEFAADFYLLRPQDPARGNGSLFMEIPNRGGKGMLSLLNQAAGSLDPVMPDEYGDGFLLRQGFTLVWIGWQFDVRDGPMRLRLHAPVATADPPITGLVRSDFVLPVEDTFQPIGHIIAGNLGGKEYPVADPESPESRLTVRDRPTAPRTRIPRRAWTFREEDGAVTGIEYREGFEPGKIYELIYEARDPALVGLGLVAVRDFASWAKHDPEALAPVERAVAFGISQSGRFLRHFLYQGFNADEGGRRAFDGVVSHVAGAGRGSFNHRFAQPSRDFQPMEALFYPTDLYPFTDLPMPDRVTGRNEGLLGRAARDGVLPKVFYTNTSHEYWGRAASLIHTNPDGTADAPQMSNVRIYHLAGLQHFPVPLPPRLMPLPHLRGRYLMNPNPSAWTLRALVVAMQRWLTEGAEPPASAHPRLDDGTLASFEDVKAAFPSIPGVDFPRDAHQAWRIDFGPEWKQGIITRHPPRVGLPFPVWLPAVDEDGNEHGGVRIPQLEVPVATYTPWNLRDPSIGAPSERVSFLGSYFPFARTKAEREETGDPRASLEERYQSFEQYLGLYTQAALRLVKQGVLLPEDLAAVVRRGEQEWRQATGTTAEPAAENQQ